MSLGSGLQGLSGALQGISGNSAKPLTPPSGYSFIIDDYDGAYVIDDYDGAYVIEAT